MDLSDLDNLFTYHRPTEDQAKRYERINAAGKAFAAEVLECTPPGPDQSAAIRQIREARMTANAAIACGEPDADAQDAQSKEG